MTQTCEQLKAVDWNDVSRELNAQGHAVLQHLLAPEECRVLSAMYGQEELFRSRVVMGRHGFGRGEYQYFRYPLPEIVANLRRCVYTPIVSFH